ncbi:hypothetical protein Tco_0260105 [Tanacetum coccineum]
MSKLKVLDALPSLFSKVTEALDRFANAIESASQKAGDQSVLSAGQAGTQHAEGEKNTRQAIITQLFKQRTTKDAKKANLNTQPIPTTSPITTTIISPIIPTINKGKEAMTHKETKEEESETDSEPAVRLTGSMVESSKKKKLKKFDFATKEEVGKEELVDLLGIDVVTNVYKAKIKYDKEDDFDEVIPNFKDSDLHLGKWRELEIDFCKPLEEQDLLDKLNELAKKRGNMLMPFKTTSGPPKGMILFNSHKRKDLVSIEDFKELNNEMMYTVQESFLDFTKDLSKMI